MSEAALKRSLEQINEALKEPISAPRINKVRKVTDKVRRLTNKEIDEIVAQGVAQGAGVRTVRKRLKETKKVTGMTLAKQVLDKHNEELEELSKSERKPPKKVTKLKNKNPVNMAVEKEALLEPLEELAKSPRKPPKRVEAAEAAKRKKTEQKMERSAVTINDLAEETGMQHQLVRLHLRKAGIEKPGARWQWTSGSREWAKARKALKLPVEKT